MFWGGGILVSRIYNYTQGKYQNINNTKVAIVVDNKKEKSIPNRGYYKVDVDCGDARGEWDYNAWSLKIDEIKEGTKCDITFTSGLSEDKYQEYLNAGVNARRNTYRGKDITDYKNLPDDNEMNLYKQISSCQFNDIYVGDYIKSTKDGKEIIWLIADINNYLYSGYTPLTTCHATIIPAGPLGSVQQMNELVNGGHTTGVVDANLTVTTSDGTKKTGVGAYVGSKMKQEILPNILKDYVIPVFDEKHIIKYTNLLADQMEQSRSNQLGTPTGASSSWAWYDSQIDLMSEVNVYGSTVWSSSGYDVGIDNRQYAIFKLKPEFINSDGNTRYYYWLKAVVSFQLFASSYVTGEASISYAAHENYVRPRFLID